MAFKMKGSPMQRNFGIGNSGFKQNDDKKTNEFLIEDQQARRTNRLPQTRFPKESVIPQSQGGTGKRIRYGGSSAMKNYKKGYYGEGSSMKLTDEETDPHLHLVAKDDTNRKRPTPPKMMMKRVKGKLIKKELTSKSKYTGRTPQSQMTDTEYKRMLQKKKK